MKMSFIYMRTKKIIFHINGFALRHGLKQRFEATRKWLINNYSMTAR